MNKPMTDGAGCAPTRASEVSQQMEMLNLEITRAEGLSESMRERLAIVLRDEPATPAITPQDEEALTSLAGDIGGFVGRLRRITDGYESLLARLEL